MNKAVLSVKHPKFAEELKRYGYEIIPGETVEEFIPYERDHVDMQCLIINDTAFVLTCCKKLINALSGAYNVISCGDYITDIYPSNVALNAAVTGKYVICRINALDDRVRSYCEGNGFKLINTRQGYSKCSCAVVSDNALITADKSIYKALQNTDIDVLPIGEGSVLLEGADHGFIGGASGYDKSSNTLYFCGSIDTHPDNKEIKRFCAYHGTNIVSLTDEPLTDIGGIIFVNYLTNR